MPVTTTRPLQLKINSIARSNVEAIGPAIRSASARNASASIRTTFSPTRFINIRMLARAHAGSFHQGICRDKSRMVLEVVFHPVVSLRHFTQSMRLDQTVPWAGLPVVFFLRSMDPRWQLYKQSVGHCLRVGFIHQAQLFQFLLCLVSITQMQFLFLQMGAKAGQLALG